MRKITPKEAQAGMFITAQVKTPLGQVLAEPGTELTRQLINKMKLYKVEYIMVEGDDPNAAPEPAPAPVPKTHAQESITHNQKILVSDEFRDFQLKYLSCINDIKDTFNDICDGKDSIDEVKMLSSVIELFASCHTTMELFDLLYNMRSIADPLYSHSLNVGLISRMIGRWLRLEKRDLNTLTISGLLHDVGKCKIPEEILNKPGKLTDEEFALIRQHPKFGHDMLKKLPIDSRIKRAALMHHERCDGSGYPSHINGDLIDDFAMIVGIADVYDAMTAARLYRAPLCPFQVIASFEDEGFAKYNTQYLLVFLKKLAAAYQNNRVMLSDGRSCNIVMMHPHELSRPIVQFDDNKVVDLALRRDLFIKSVM